MKDIVWMLFSIPWCLNHGRSLVPHVSGEIQRINSLVCFNETSSSLHQYQNSRTSNTGTEIIFVTKYFILVKYHTNYDNNS